MNVYDLNEEEHIFLMLDIPFDENVYVKAKSDEE